MVEEDLSQQHEEEEEEDKQQQQPQQEPTEMKMMKKKKKSVLPTEQQIAEMENWFRVQPHLPQKIEKFLLQRFMYSMDGDVKATQQLLQLNFKMRNKHSHIFIERDPLDDKSQQLLNVVDFIPLPGLTNENNKLLLYRLSDPNPDKFNFLDAIRMFFMMADCRFAVETEIADGEIPVFDMEGYTMRHLTKTVLSALRVYMKFVQEAHPVRIRQIHVLNCPTYLDKVLMVAKPFIKSEIFKLIKFHLPNADTPYDYFPKEMLPDEYGGKAGTLQELRTSWWQILKEQRTYLMDEDYWRIGNSKKKLLADENPKAETEILTLNQNLKTLEID